MPKPHSHSSLDEHKQCNYRSKRIREDNAFKDKGNPQAEFGSEQHDIAETALKKDQVIVGEMGRALEFVRGHTGLKAAELYLGVDVDMKPCDPLDEEVCWFRGKIDVTIMNGDKATIIDYKTGKRKLPFGVKGARRPSEDQMIRYALLTFLHNKHIQDIDAYLYWTHNGHRPDRYRFNRSVDAVRMIKFMRSEPGKIDKNRKSGKWKQNHSGLCLEHCPVEDCTFYQVPMKRY